MRDIVFGLVLTWTTLLSAALPDDLEFIPHVAIEDSVLENGRFTERSLPIVLEAAYKQGKLGLPEFKSASCLKARNLIKAGGYSTQQLFGVNSSCAGAAEASFIIKEATNGLTEAIRLEAIKHFSGVAPIAAPNSVDGFPTLALPVAFLSYLDDGLVHYLSIMPAAKGSDLCNFIKINRGLGESQKRAIRRAYHALGRELANFQQAFKETHSNVLLSDTLVHSDLKCLNVFYDAKAKHFTFIDNETMEDSLEEPASPSRDIVKILFGNLANNENELIRRQLDGVNLNQWYKQSFKSFLQGYISVFPKADRVRVLMEMKALLNQPFVGLAMEYDEPRVEDVRKKYIRPILDQMIKTETSHRIPTVSCSNSHCLRETPPP